MVDAGWVVHTSRGPQAALPSGDQCGGRKPWGTKRGKAECLEVAPTAFAEDAAPGRTDRRRPLPGTRRAASAHQ